MPKAYLFAWFSFIVISSSVMVGLYSRVVCSLWLKCSDDNGLTRQQQVKLFVKIDAISVKLKAKQYKHFCKTKTDTSVN